MPFYEWSITTGLVRVPGKSSMYGTGEPRKLLSTLHRMDTQAIFLLKDFARFTTDHTVARQLREVSQRFAKNRSTLVLSEATIRLSPEIEHKWGPFSSKAPGKRRTAKGVQHGGEFFGLSQPD